MDEILVSDFIVFHDVVEAGRTTCGSAMRRRDQTTSCTGPGAQRAAYYWLDRLVGWCRSTDGGRARGVLTADYDAEMVGTVGALPTPARLGASSATPTTLVCPDRLGPLPLIRGSTQEHFDFTGYVSGFDRSVHRRQALRAGAGAMAAHGRVCVLDVGGLASAASPPPRDRRPPARDCQVPGLRTYRRRRAARRRSQSLPRHEGLEDHRSSTTCTTTWPRATSRSSRAVCNRDGVRHHRRPFIYFPLDTTSAELPRPSPLDRYRAALHGHRRLVARLIAAAVAEEVGGVGYRPVGDRRRAAAPRERLRRAA